MQNHTDASRLSNPTVASFLAAFCAIIWGSAYPGVKLGYSLFAIGGDDTAAKLVFAGCRFFSAGLIVLVGRWIFLSWTSRRRIQGKAVAKRQPLAFKDMLQLLILGLLQSGVHYFFFYIGLSYTTGAKGSIINSTSVFFGAILAHVFYKNDHMSSRKILGLIIGFTGVVMVNFTKDLGLSFTLNGDGFIMLAALIFASTSLYSKHITGKLDPVVVSGGHLTIGGAALLSTGAAMGASLPEGGIQAWLVLGYLALLSSVAFTIWAALLKHNKVSSIMVFNFLTPVSGTILSAIVLHESILQMQYLLALPAVAIGVYLVNSLPKHEL